MSPITVLLVDDHVAVRQAVRVLLETERDVTIVAEAGDGGEAVREANRWRPTVAIVDLTMPGVPGLAAIRQLRAVSPRTAVLVFTLHKNAAYVYEAMRAGARGYVLKSARKEELIGAVRALHAGGGFLQPEITGLVLRRIAVDARLEAGRTDLTVREIQVLEAVADGRSDKEIAASFAIAEDTVKTHLRKLFEKLGASDRAQAVAIALRQQLIE